MLMLLLMMTMMMMMMMLIWWVLGREVVLVQWSKPAHLLTHNCVWRQFSETCNTKFSVFSAVQNQHSQSATGAFKCSSDDASCCSNCKAGSYLDWQLQSMLSTASELPTSSSVPTSAHQLDCLLVLSRLFARWKVTGPWVTPNKPLASVSDCQDVSDTKATCFPLSLFQWYLLQMWGQWTAWWSCTSTRAPRTPPTPAPCLQPTAGCLLMAMSFQKVSSPNLHPNIF